MRAESMEGPNSGVRDNNFDFLRFFLATLVVLAHSFYLLGERGAHFGAMAVLGFFGISGFLVTQSWLRSRSVLDYASKRALRIYPGFAAACLFAHLVVAPIAMGSGVEYLGGIDVPQILREIVLLKQPDIPGVFQDLPIRAVNGSLWSVPFEALCYVMLAGLGLAGVVGRRRALLALTGVLWAIQAVLPLAPRLDDAAGKFGYVLPYVVGFLAGAVLCVDRERLAPSPRRVAIVLALMIATVWHRKLVGLVWPVGLPYLMLWIAHHPRVPFQRWGRPGDFSYGLYLFAFPIQQLLVQFAGLRINPIALFLASMLLTVPVAVASWYLVERPFLRIRERRTARAKARAAAAGEPRAA